MYNVTDGGFHQHYGRDNTVRNNILAFSEQEQVRGTAQKKAGDHLSFTFERNIVYFDQGELFGRDFQWGPDVQVNLKNNIYWRTGGQRFDFAGKSWDQWRAMGRDKEGSIIADPKFVDPTTTISASLPTRSSSRPASSPLTTPGRASTAMRPGSPWRRQHPIQTKENNHDKPR